MTAAEFYKMAEDGRVQIEDVLAALEAREQEVEALSDALEVRCEEIMWTKDILALITELRALRRENEKLRDEIDYLTEALNK